MRKPRRELEHPPGPLKEALAALNHVYVSTSAHAEGMAELRRLFMSASVSEGHQGLCIVGPGGVGKTTAWRQTNRWLRQALEMPSDSPSPFPLFTLRADASPKSLMAGALDSLGDPLSNIGTRYELERRFNVLSKEADVYGIAFDEVHHSYEGRTPAEAHAMAQTFKNVVNHFRRPIVFLGTEGLDEYVRGSNELSQRFQRIVYFDNFALNTKECIADMHLVLSAMDEVLPAEPGCSLGSQEMVLRLFVGAERRFGSVVSLVRRACERGAADGDVRIGLRHYSAAFRISAPRASRTDLHDPFVLPMSEVTKLAAAMRVTSR